MVNLPIIRLLVIAYISDACRICADNHDACDIHLHTYWDYEEDINVGVREVLCTCGEVYEVTAAWVVCIFASTRERCCPNQLIDYHAIRLAIVKRQGCRRPAIDLGHKP